MTHTVIPAKAGIPSLAVLAALSLVAACSSNPPAPQWQSNAYGSLGSFTQAYLRGDSVLAELEFNRARSETASTGRFDLVARTELVRCAAQVAALELNGCPGYAAIAQDAAPTERAYAAYIQGRFAEATATMLPEQHRAIVGGGAVSAIADPLARLVAAGALMQAGRITPADVVSAVDTASAQGWRRPLLAWLGVQLKRAEAAGDTAAANQLRRRIALASTPP